MRDAVLRAYLMVLIALVAAFYAVRSALPSSFQVPGSTPMHLLAVAGSLLMLSTLLFPYTKRLVRRGGERRAHHLHMLAGATGAALVLVHASGYLSRPPALLLLAALGLVATGAYGRLLAGRLRYLEFAGDAAAFGPARSADSARSFAVLASAKSALLPRLDPAAAEATFSVNLAHWLHRPRLAFAYWRLAFAEERLVTRQRRAPASPVYGLQRTWRLLHLALVALLVTGIVAHVVAVTFFAGYAAEGSEPYWWYLRR